MLVRRWRLVGLVPDGTGTVPCSVPTLVPRASGTVYRLLAVRLGCCAPPPRPVGWSSWGVCCGLELPLFLLLSLVCVFRLLSPLCSGLCFFVAFAGCSGPLAGCRVSPLMALLCASKRDARGSARSSSGGALPRCTAQFYAWDAVKLILRRRLAACDRIPVSPWVSKRAG